MESGEWTTQVGGQGLHSLEGEEHGGGREQEWACAGRRDAAEGQARPAACAQVLPPVQGA